MNIVRKYLALSLLIAPAFVQAADNEGGMDGWLSTNARWHYTKQVGYGAVEGAGVSLIAALAQQNGFGTLSNPAHALIAMGVTYGASKYIRNHSEKNQSGADASHPAFAWASNAAGYIALGGAVAYYLLTNVKAK